MMKYTKESTKICPIDPKVAHYKISLLLSPLSHKKESDKQKNLKKYLQNISPTGPKFDDYSIRIINICRNLLN